MEDKIKLNAHAKINVALDVAGKRDDGYHEDHRAGTSD